MGLETLSDSGPPRSWKYQLWSLLDSNTMFLAVQGVFVSGVVLYRVPIEVLT